MPFIPGIAVILLLPILHFLHHDYKAFIALGPGGTPKTVAGYLRVKALSLFALRDPYSATPIPPSFRNDPGYLTSLPHREGPRPTTRGIAPHRQTTQKGTAEMYDTLFAAINRAGDSSAALKTGKSCFEKHGTALFSVSPARRTCKGEICHIHYSDGSLHLTLHPADARLVLEAGLGERHPLARGGWLERFVPAGFLMVYAPRDEGELRAVLDVIEAAAWFVCGGDAAAWLGEVGREELGAAAVKKIEAERRDSGYVSTDEGHGQSVHA